MCKIEPEKLTKPHLGNASMCTLTFLVTAPDNRYRHLRVEGLCTIEFVFWFLYNSWRHSSMDSSPSTHTCSIKQTQWKNSSTYGCFFRYLVQVVQRINTLHLPLHSSTFWMIYVVGNVKGNILLCIMLHVRHFHKNSVAFSWSS